MELEDRWGVGPGGKGVVKVSVRLKLRSCECGYVKAMAKVMVGPRNIPRGWARVEARWEVAERAQGKHIVRANRW